MNITLKAWAHYLYYVFVNRPKFVVGTVLTIVSLVGTLFSLVDADLDFLTLIGIAGTIAGAFLTMSDVKGLRGEVDDLEISDHYNTAAIDSLTNRNSLARIGDRYYLIDEALNAEIIGGSLNKPIDIRSPYKLYDKARELNGVTGFALLSYFRSGKFHSQTAFKSRIPVWNDTKIRLDTAPYKLASDPTIAIRPTSYFDYISAGFFCLRKIELKGAKAIIGNELIVGSGQADGTWTLAEITEARTAHHIGINLILTDSNHRLLYQKKNLSPGKVGNCAPSGSGSLDMADLNESFEASIIKGALREFCEETGWDKLVTSEAFKSKEFTCRPIGLSIDLTRGLITDFFVHAYTEGDIKDFVDRSSGTNHHDQFEIGKNSIDYFELLPPDGKSPIQVLDELLRSPNVVSSAMLNIALGFLKSAAMTAPQIGKFLGGIAER